jgi:flagellar biosynthetic protein FliO
VEYVDWASFAASFLLVIGLILVTLWGFKRYGQMQFPKKNGDAAIQIIESHAMGPRQRIVLVHCENQRILIGVAPQGFAHLGQWTSDGKPPDASFIETLRAVEQPSE